jgi:Ca2+/Na+ antiporter
MNIIPQVDTYPRVVSFCQTTAGKAATLAAFAATLILNRVGPWIALTMVAAVITFFPARRRLMLSLGALYWLIFDHGWLRVDITRQIAKAEGQRTDWAFALMAGIVLVGVFCGIAAFVHHVRVQRLSFSSRRPVLVLVCGFFAVLMAAGTLPLHGLARVLVWLLISVLAPYLWFFAYALTDAASKTPERLEVQFGFIRPFWMGEFGSFVPIAKGAAYLRKVEAKTPKDFAIVQLKAVKLLMWVFVLKSLEWVFDRAMHGGTNHLLQRLFQVNNLPNLGIPTLAAAYQQTAAGGRLPLPLAWGCVTANFVEALLSLYVVGNVAVACCRMAGFHALRNTYRPFQSQTLVDFWNRYYYYFKELLVEFFFFPCYLRYFKKHPRLRLFAATISAATAGNLLYHFGRDYSNVAEVGFWKAVSRFEVQATYALFLGVSIGISQLRNRRERKAMSLPRRVFASATVILFYALLQTFDPEDRVYPLSVHVTFLWNLVQP